MHMLRFAEESSMQRPRLSTDELPTADGKP